MDHVSSLLLFVHSIVALVKVGRALVKHICDASLSISVFSHLLQILLYAVKKRPFYNGLAPVHKMRLWLLSRLLDLVLTCHSHNGTRYQAWLEGLQLAVLLTLLYLLLPSHDHGQVLFDY